MGHRCHELAIARLSNYLAIHHHRLTSQYRPNWHSFNFPPMVRRPANFRVSRLVADDCFLIHVDDYHVGVGARLDGPFSRVHTEDASGIVRRNAHESIER
jgi:hypothetical protein